MKSQEVQMPGKKLPTAVVDARGGFKNRPSRKRNAEPECKGPLGSAPEDFAADEVAAWMQIVDRAPIGVLASADWIAVVMAAKLFAEFMRDSEAMNAAKLSRLHSLLGDMGMSPSSRASLSIPEPKAENPFAMLDQKYPHKR
jgi:hypothetical protein